MTSIINNTNPYIYIPILKKFDKIWSINATNINTIDNIAIPTLEPLLVPSNFSENGYDLLLIKKFNIVINIIDKNTIIRCFITPSEYIIINNIDISIYGGITSLKNIPFITPLYIDDIFLIGATS